MIKNKSILELGKMHAFIIIFYLGGEVGGVLLLLGGFFVFV